MLDRILLSGPDVGLAEREALLRAFDSGWIAPVGPDLDAFERELGAAVGADACVALSSATAGLQLSLLTVGLEPGQEVVVPTLTFAASAFAVHHAGGQPVFCDVDSDTWCLDVELVDQIFRERAAAGAVLPAAVMSVDLYGMSPDYRELNAVCRRWGVPLIEDAAEGLGSSQRGEPVGGLGDIGVFSFNGNKIITTSGGGAVIGPPDLIDHVRYLSTQARQPVLHYEHLDIGFNHRMSNLLAALGRAQLASLEEKVARRRAINDRYRADLPLIDWPQPSSIGDGNCWLSVGLLPDGVEPAQLCSELLELGIEARPVWKPMHQQPVFSKAQVKGGSVADDLYRRGICLPSGSALTEVCVDRVVDAVLTCASRP